MESNDPTNSAETLRKRGNEFYMKKKMSKAIDCYRQSAELDKISPLPLSNLSAALFENGEYIASIKATEEAHQRCGDDHTTLQRKLDLRLISAYIHGGLGQKVPTRISTLVQKSQNDDEELKEALDSLEAADRCFRLHQPKSEHWNKVIHTLPLVKSRFVHGMEYYPFGHDQAFPLIDAKSLNGIGPKANINLLFGGVGDGRNLLTTLQIIAAAELKKKSSRRYRITVNDIKPAVLARLIVIFLGLEESTYNMTDEKELLTTTNALFFTYASPIVPPKVYEYLQQIISLAIKGIEKETLPQWFTVRPESRSSILSILRGWLHDAAELPTTKEIVKATVASCESTWNPEMIKDEFSEEIGLEILCFFSTAMVFPDMAILEKEDPVLHKLVHEYQTHKRPEILPKIRARVISKWKPNLTVLDKEWLSSGDHLSSINPEPWSLVSRFDISYDIKKKGTSNAIFPIAHDIFKHMATFLAYLKVESDFIIEMDQGDIAQTLQRALISRLRFDRIHLSNIPDYLGGSLFTSLYAIPCLANHKFAFTTFCNLRNPNQFKNHHFFNNESLVMYKPEDLALVLGMKDGGSFEDPNDPIAMFHPFPLVLYHTWTKVVHGLKVEDLIPRTNLETWMYALLLKLCIPCERPSNEALNAVYSPLNLTVFFRLLHHLHDMGYPAHWLSKILYQILTNKVITAARPPESSPLSFQDSQFDSKPAWFDFAPFLPELSTLTSLYRPILPFGIAAGKLIPSIDSIEEYTIQFPTILDKGDLTRNEYTLVFMTKMVYEKVFTFRPGHQFNLVHDSKLHDYVCHQRESRMSSIIILTTFKWSSNDRRANFWLPNDVFSPINSSSQSGNNPGKVYNSRNPKNWLAMLVRLDSWLPVSIPPVPLTRGLEKASPNAWVDQDMS